MKSNDLAISLAAKIAGLLMILVPVFAVLTDFSIPLDGKSLWFVSVVGIGLLGFGYFTAIDARIFGALVLSLIAGGGAQLWMTQPLWYPSLRPDRENHIYLLMAAIIGIQLLLATFTILRTGKLKSTSRLLKEFGAFRILIFLLLSAAFSVSMMSYIPSSNWTSYIFQLAAGGVLLGVNILTITAMLCLPAPFGKSRGFHPIVPSLVTFVASVALGLFAFENLPHVGDELIYMFQAQTFASGNFSVPAPPDAVQPGLEYFLLEVRDGRWFATTPPGWPGILTLGVLISAPWLMNPLMAALSVLLAHNITSRLAGQTRADVVALLMCTSPWFLATSASLMPHNTSILFTLLSWWLLLLPTGSIRKTVAISLIAGLAMGWVFTTRQLEGVLIGTLAGLWLISKWKQPMAMTRTAFYSLGAIVTGCFYLFHNFALTGNPLLSPLERYLNEHWREGANSFGFGTEVGSPSGWRFLDIFPGHSPFEGLIHTLHNISALQLELSGWAIGSLALVYALLLWGRPDRKDQAMFAVAGMIVLAMFFYWFSGSFYVGPRYWFGLFFPMVYLSASGFGAIQRRLQNLNVDSHSAGIVLFILCLFGLLVFTPWRGVEKYYQYANFDADVRDAYKSGAFSNALVIFDIHRDPASAFMLNDPYLPADKPIFIMDSGPEKNAAARAAFADRQLKTYSSD